SSQVEEAIIDSWNHADETELKVPIITGVQIGVDKESPGPGLEGCGESPPAFKEAVPKLESTTIDGLQPAKTVKEVPIDQFCQTVTLSVRDQLLVSTSAEREEGKDPRQGIQSQST